MDKIVKIRNKFLKKIKLILTAYAQIYFSQKWQVGLLFLLATFIIPNQGIAGLLVLLLSNKIAKLLSLPKYHIKEGFFAYNGLLIGLALGLTYRMNLNFIILLIIASFLGVIISTVIRTISDKIFYLPALSFPFVITTWILISAGEKFTGLIYATKPFEIDLLLNFFPKGVEFFLRSTSAALFQLNVPAGILILLGILIFSRQAFLLGLLGLSLGSIVYKQLGGSVNDLQGHWIAFNFILTSIAVGGIFVVPSISSYLLASFGAILSAVITASSMSILGVLSLPTLAFPFLLTTSIILYTLKLRLNPKTLKTVLAPKESPEENLKFSKNRRMDILSDSVPLFELPVNGEWTITQGFDGEFTHQKAWAYAWDFEVKDENKKTYQNFGVQCIDYYAWGKPVLSPADGKIVKIISHIEDNPIGHINNESNWGNTVVIWHYASVYTSLSHLARGSINVKVGDFVRRRQIIAKVGNSGRSPYPHLHFQAQYSPEIGSPTAYSKLLNFVSFKNNEWVYNSISIPEKEEIVKNIDIDTSIFDSASFPVNKKWEYDVFKGNKSWKESWETSINFYGYRFIECQEKKSKLQYFSNNKFLLLLNYKGLKGTALEWFYLAIPKLPFTKLNVKWSEELNANDLLFGFSKILFELTEPFYPLAKLTSQSKFKHIEKNNFTITTKLSLKGFLSSKLGDTIITSRFEQHLGLTSLVVKRKNKIIFEVYLRRSEDEKTNVNNNPS